MSSSNQSSEAPSPMQSAISDLAKQISHLAMAQAHSDVQHAQELKYARNNALRMLPGSRERTFTFYLTMCGEKRF